MKNVRVSAETGRWWWGGRREERTVRAQAKNDPRGLALSRLAKSTLTLIPLLGTHEAIFAFVVDEHARGTLRFVKLFTELSFTSFQVTQSDLGPPAWDVPKGGRGRHQPE